MHKSKTFERAAQSIFDLFNSLYERNAITVGEATQFNDAYQIVILHYNDSLKPVATELPWPDEEFATAWADWLAYKKEQFRFTYKPRALEAALKGLHEQANGDVKAAIVIIRNSIQQSYQGLFPPKAVQANTATGGKGSAINLINANQGAANILGL